MSKPKPIQINIPNPCSQSWDEMTPSQQGRFCDHCQKTVIDFTTWSDAALYSFFSKNNGHVCGRFLSTQVDRPINIPYQPNSRLYRMTVALGLTLLFAQTPQLLAQNAPPKVAVNAAPMKSRTMHTFKVGTVGGYVIDISERPLQNATIELSQGGVVKARALSDSDGVYIVNGLKEGNYTASYRHDGYREFILNNLIVDSIQGIDLTITLELPQNGDKSPMISGYNKQEAFLEIPELNSIVPTFAMGTPPMPTPIIVVDPPKRSKKKNRVHLKNTTNNPQQDQTKTKTN